MVEAQSTRTMTWKEIDEKLVRRGELILDLNFLDTTNRN